MAEAEKICCYVTSKQGYFLRQFGFEGTDGSGDNVVRATSLPDTCTITHSNLVEYNLLLQCLKDGYDVFNAATSDSGRMIDFTRCKRTQLKLYEVDSTTYAAISSIPKPEKLVPIKFVGKAPSLMVGNIIDVYTSSAPGSHERIQWKGAHPDIDDTLQFARVL